MSLRENIQNLFKPEAVKEAEKALERRKTFRQEGVATVAYLEGNISLDEYRERLKTTFPLTKLDLRKLASELN